MWNQLLDAIRLKTHLAILNYLLALFGVCIFAKELGTSSKILAKTVNHLMNDFNSM